MANALRSDVIISGGGIVGLTLALALATALDGKLSIAVIDPGPLDPSRIRDDVRARALGAASIRFLTAIGVWPAIEPYAQRVSAVDITDSALMDGIRPTLSSYDPDLDGEAMLIVENAPLMRIVTTAARAAPGVTLLPGRRVAALTSAQQRPAAVTLDDGTIRIATVVAAADGRSSPLREMAGIKSMGWSYRQAGIVTTIAHELPHGGRAVQHFLPGGPFALLPLIGGRCCVTWTEEATEAARLMTVDDTAFLQALEQRAGGRLGRISLAGSRQSWPLELHLARALAADRITLIGDAARSVHPLAGQGLNLGLRDCAAFADVIEDAALAGQDIGVATTLERYERWRRADGAFSAAAFDGLNRLFSNDVGILRMARAAGLGLLERSPTSKRWLLGEAAGLTGDLPRTMRRAEVSETRSR